MEGFTCFFKNYCNGSAQFQHGSEGLRTSKNPASPFRKFLEFCQGVGRREWAVGRCGCLTWVGRCGHVWIGWTVQPASQGSMVSSPCHKGLGSHSTRPSRPPSPLDT